MRLRSASAFFFSASMRLLSASAFLFSASMRFLSASAFSFSASMRLLSASAFLFSASMRFLSASAFSFSASMRLALGLGLLLLRLDALSLRLGLAAGFLGPLLLRSGRLRLLFESALLLRLLAALPLQQRELLLLLRAPRRQRRLLLLQRLDPPCLRLALSGELREALRLLALTFALGRHVFPLALAPQPLELQKPAFLLGTTALRGFGFAFELLDSLAVLPASLLVLLAQAFELLGDPGLVDDHRLDRLHLGPRRHRCRRVPEPEDEHRRHDGVKRQCKDGRHHPIEQGVPAHQRTSRGASVIRPTLGAPAPLQDRHQEYHVSVGHVLVAAHHDRQSRPMAQQRP